MNYIENQSTKLISFTNDASIIAKNQIYGMRIFKWDTVFLEALTRLCLDIEGNKERQHKRPTMWLFDMLSEE